MATPIIRTYRPKYTDYSTHIESIYSYIIVHGIPLQFEMKLLTY